MIKQLDCRKPSSGRPPGTNAILVLDQDGFVLATSRGASLLTRYGQDELVGLHIAELAGETTTAAPSPSGRGCLHHRLTQSDGGPVEVGARAFHSRFEGIDVVSRLARERGRSNRVAPIGHQALNDHRPSES